MAWKQWNASADSGCYLWGRVKSVSEARDATSDLYAGNIMRNG